MSSRAAQKRRQRTMDKFNGQTIAPPIAPIPIQLSPHQAAVMTATMRVQSSLSIEASQLEGTYGQVEGAKFFQKLAGLVAAFAKEYIDTNSRRVVPATIIPDLGGA